jgi:hypothetical protein
MHEGDAGIWGGGPMMVVLGALAGVGFLAVLAAVVSAVTCWD